MTTTLIVGASGNVGSVLAELLQAKGQTVRKATSRPPVAADQVQLDVIKGTGTDAAMRDAQQAFLLAPPGYTQQDKLLKPLIDSAKAQGVQKIVLMSAMGADFDESTPLRQAELHLERSGLRYNIIRPNWFMQNFNTFWIQGILQAGKIFLPTGKAKGSFIDARDIAAVASELLTSSRHEQQAFDLTGAQALDHDEVAAILSKASGRPITYEDIPDEAMLSALTGAGLPRDYAEFLLIILGAFKAGAAQRITQAVPEIIGRAPISLEQYAKDYRDAWAPQKS